jgi:hypothetical protein
MSYPPSSLPGRRRERAAVLALAMCLSAGIAARAAPAAPAAEADALSIEACLAEPSMNGRDPRECGDRILRQCLADANAASQAGAIAIACEKRRSDAWNLLARRAYRRLEAKLGDADRRLLRTAQVQFELELRDLCAATRMLAGGDPDLASAACASDLVAAHALSLARLSAGPGPASR